MCTSPKDAYVPLSATQYGAKQELRFNRPLPRDMNHYRRLSLPCGKCVECRMQYAREWANRCVLEMQYHEHTHFLTLTYDDAHLPRTFSANEETGECVSPAATLVPRDLQLFLKRLRFNTQQSIRFFAAGEYGTNTFRPHYHLIIFGLNCQYELQRQSPLGNNYYTSLEIDRAWRDQYGDPIGYHLIAPASWKTCAYVARYILKKQTGEEGRRAYRKFNIEPPFTRMSRRPGLGYQYFVDHPDCCAFHHISAGDVDGAREFFPPAYFRRMLKEIDPVSADWYSIERQTAAESAEEIKLKMLTDKDVYDILKDNERRALGISKKLPRPDF